MCLEGGGRSLGRVPKGMNGGGTPRVPGFVMGSRRAVTRRRVGLVAHGLGS